MKRDIYSGHMRKTGKKKTRYTDAEIERIRSEAYEQGRADSGTHPKTPRTDTDAYSRGRHKGRIAQLSELADWLETADGRPGKRQVLDRIAQLKDELRQEPDW